MPISPDFEQNHFLPSPSPQTLVFSLPFASNVVCSLQGGRVCLSNSPVSDRLGAVGACRETEVNSHTCLHALSPLLTSFKRWNLRSFLSHSCRNALKNTVRASSAGHQTPNANAQQAPIHICDMHFYEGTIKHVFFFCTTVLFFFFSCTISPSMEPH